MPEEIEVDTDKLRETIDAEIEKSGGRMLRLTALTTAILAAITAIASLRAGSTVNEALVLESEATQLQAKASDQWAYYQAKGIKGAVAANAASAYGAAGRTAPDSLLALAARYTREQGDIQTEAKKLEQERDTKVAEASKLLEQHHRFAYSVALLQVAIALGAVAALTRQGKVLALSLLAGASGIVVALVAGFGG
jgi:Domain of unknown function (DUF4337)